MSGKIGNETASGTTAMQQGRDRADNPFDSLTDAQAIEAAAKLVRTASMNLLCEDTSDDAAWLYVLSEELFKVVNDLERAEGRGSVLSHRLI